jgi:hypothetical protein
MTTHENTVHPYGAQLTFWKVETCVNNVVSG